jgi:hypothetical protein
MSGVCKNLRTLIKQEGYLPKVFEDQIDLFSTFDKMIMQRVASLSDIEIFEGETDIEKEVFIEEYFEYYLKVRGL